MVDGVDVDLGGNHMFTSDVDAYAEIKMTFTSFYIISALYPCPLGANVMLDGTTIKNIDLTSRDVQVNTLCDNLTHMHGIVPHDIVFAYHGNSSQEHVIRLSSGGYSGSALDAFLFETDSSGNVDPTASNLNNRTKYIAIGLGVGIPVLLLVILVPLLLLCKRRKSKKIVDFDPSAMGGRPATQQGVYPDDASAANDDDCQSASRDSLALGTPQLVPAMAGSAGDGPQRLSNAQTKTLDTDSPLMAALLSERNVTGSLPLASTLSTSPNSTTSLVNHHSRSLSSHSISGDAPRRPLSPVHHPSLRAQIQSRRRENSITNAGLELAGAYKI